MVKFCLIAAGEADLYVRCVPTMEWDTAAGDHVLTMAGGRVVGPDGTIPGRWPQPPPPRGAGRNTTRRSAAAG
jgi:fructose-1,6-bisphosphatase/inositol monophosphatase family enzyme